MDVYCIERITYHCADNGEMYEFERRAVKICKTSTNALRTLAKMKRDAWSGCSQPLEISKWKVYA